MATETSNDQFWGAALVDSQASDLIQFEELYPTAPLDATTSVSFLIEVNTT
jgi:hypothetical protein